LNQKPKGNIGNYEIHEHVENGSYFSYMKQLENNQINDCIYDCSNENHL
jgi:hypothetical protein